MKLRPWLLNAVAPSLCLLCEADLSWAAPPGMCARCLIRLLREPVDGTPPEGVRALLSAFRYQEKVRGILYRFKEGGRGYLAKLFSRAWRRRWPGRYPWEVVTAVPSTPWRVWRRGYNPAELFARQLAEATGRPYVDLGLRRRIWAPAQKRFGRRRRFANASAAFHRVGKPLTLKRILLLDDVCTTGATLAACAELLRQAGAEEVWAGAAVREERRGNGEILAEGVDESQSIHI